MGCAASLSAHPTSSGESSTRATTNNSASSHKEHLQQAAARAREALQRVREEEEKRAQQLKAQRDAEKEHAKAEKARREQQQGREKKEATGKDIPNPINAIAVRNNFQQTHPYDPRTSIVAAGGKGARKSYINDVLASASSPSNLEDSLLLFGGDGGLLFKQVNSAQSVLVGGDLVLAPGDSGEGGQPPQTTVKQLTYYNKKTNAVENYNGDILLARRQQLYLGTFGTGEDNEEGNKKGGPTGGGCPSPVHENGHHYYGMPMRNMSERELSGVLNGSFESAYTEHLKKSKRRQGRSEKSFPHHNINNNMNTSEGIRPQVPQRVSSGVVGGGMSEVPTTITQHANNNNIISQPHHHHHQTGNTTTVTPPTASSMPITTPSGALLASSSCCLDGAIAFSHTLVPITFASNYVSSCENHQRLGQRQHEHQQQKMQQQRNDLSHSPTRFVAVGPAASEAEFHHMRQLEGSIPHYSYPHPHPQHANSNQPLRINPSPQFSSPHQQQQQLPMHHHHNQQQPNQTFATSRRQGIGERVENFFGREKGPSGGGGARRVSSHNNNHSPPTFVVPASPMVSQPSSRTPSSCRPARSPSFVFRSASNAGSVSSPIARHPMSSFEAVMMFGEEKGGGTGLFSEEAVGTGMPLLHGPRPRRAARSFVAPAEGDVRRNDELSLHPVDAGVGRSSTNATKDTTGKGRCGGEKIDDMEMLGPPNADKLIREEKKLGVDALVSAVAEEASANEEEEGCTERANKKRTRLPLSSSCVVFLPESAVALRTSSSQHDNNNNNNNSPHKTDRSYGGGSPIGVKSSPATIQGVAVTTGSHPPRNPYSDSESENDAEKKIERRNKNEKDIATKIAPKKKRSGNSKEEDGTNQTSTVVTIERLVIAQDKSTKRRAGTDSDIIGLGIQKQNEPKNDSFSAKAAGMSSVFSPPLGKEPSTTPQHDNRGVERSPATVSKKPQDALSPLSIAFYQTKNKTSTIATVETGAAVRCDAPSAEGREVSYSAGGSVYPSYMSVFPLSPITASNNTSPTAAAAATNARRANTDALSRLVTNDTAVPPPFALHDSSGVVAGLGQGMVEVVGGGSTVKGGGPQMVRVRSSSMASVSMSSSRASLPPLGNGSFSRLPQTLASGGGIGGGGPCCGGGALTTPRGRSARLSPLAPKSTALPTGTAAIASAAGGGAAVTNLARSTSSPSPPTAHAAIVIGTPRLPTPRGIHGPPFSTATKPSGAAPLIPSLPPIFMAGSPGSNPSPVSLADDLLHDGHDGNNNNKRTTVNPNPKSFATTITVHELGDASSRNNNNNTNACAQRDSAHHEHRNNENEKIEIVGCIDQRSSPNCKATTSGGGGGTKNKALLDEKTLSEGGIDGEEGDGGQYTYCCEGESPFFGATTSTTAGHLLGSSGGAEKWTPIALSTAAHFTPSSAAVGGPDASTSISVRVLSPSPPMNLNPNHFHAVADLHNNNNNNIIADSPHIHNSNNNNVNVNNNNNKDNKDNATTDYNTNDHHQHGVNENIVTDDARAEQAMGRPAEEQKGNASQNHVEGDLTVGQHSSSPHQQQEYNEKEEESNTRRQTLALSSLLSPVAVAGPHRSSSQPVKFVNAPHLAHPHRTSIPSHSGLEISDANSSSQKSAATTNTASQTIATVSSKTTFGSEGAEDMIANKKGGGRTCLIKCAEGEEEEDVEGSRSGGSALGARDGGGEGPATTTASSILQSPTCSRTSTLHSFFGVGGTPVRKGPTTSSRTGHSSHRNLSNNHYLTYGGRGTSQALAIGMNPPPPPLCTPAECCFTSGGNIGHQVARSDSDVLQMLIYSNTLAAVSNTNSMNTNTNTNTVGANNATATSSQNGGPAAVVAPRGSPTTQLGPPALGVTLMGIHQNYYTSHGHGGGIMVGIGGHGGAASDSQIERSFLFPLYAPPRDSIHATSTTANNNNTFATPVNNDNDTTNSNTDCDRASTLPSMPSRFDANPLGFASVASRNSESLTVGAGAAQSSGLVASGGGGALFTRSPQFRSLF